MRDDLPDPDRPVLPWWLVAGALLHSAVPAYLVLLTIWWLVARPVAELPSMVGRASLAFGIAFVALLLAASLLAALLDPPLRRRRARRDRLDPAVPARRAAAQVTRAVCRVKAIGGPRLAAAAARVRDARWDHDDAACQGIAADLERAAAAFAAAHASAAPDRREAIAHQAAAALDRVAAAVAALAGERARLDEGDARTHAAYLAQRYPGGALDRAGPDQDGGVVR